MKKLLLITFIICSVIFFSFVFLYVFVISGAFAVLMTQPPKPQITYGEFPFNITYEINGEIMTYKDVVICEYEGIKSLGTAGKERKWSRKLKSGNDYVVLLQSKTNDSPFEIYMPIPGLPEYYMGDFKKSKSDYEHSIKDVRYLGYKQNNINHSISQEDVWEQYRIKIINIECSSPIENKFE